MMWRKYIFFTWSAFKTLITIQGLKSLFSNAANFLAYITFDEDGVRVEYGWKLVNKRLGNNGDPMKVYCISIPEEEEESDVWITTLLH